MLGADFLVRNEREARICIFGLKLLGCAEQNVRTRASALPARATAFLMPDNF